MLSDEIIGFLERETLAGQEELAAIVRSLVAGRAPAIADALEGSGCEAMLEPSAFAWLTGQREDIDATQVFYCALAHELRPQRIAVVTGAAGTAYLPRCGEFIGLAPDAAMVLLPQAAGVPPQSLIGFRPSRLLAQGALELTHGVDPLIAPIFRAYSGRAQIDDSEARRLCVRLERALEDFARLAPALLRLLLHANRRIHVYRAPEPNSFATLSVHGCAFLNTPHDASEAFFLDDFAHQGGHVVFNAATHEQTRYLRLAGDTPLAQLGARDDSRTVYAAFHGLFTYSSILTVLLNAWSDAHYDHASRHELRGRIAFYLVKFHSDLELMRDTRIYTPAGAYLYEGFRDCFQRARARIYAAIADVDLSAQPYVFSPSVYVQHNPMRMPS